MNHGKLVEMMKIITKQKFLNEATHGARYQEGQDLAGRKLMSRSKIRYTNPQLAEEDDDQEEAKVKSKTGTTMTGKPADNIIKEPQYQSQMSPTQGPKPQIDSK